MFEENIGIYADGKPVDEKDIATVIGNVDDIVIFTDDQKNLFFLNVPDASAFEVGTIDRKDALTPLSDADEQLKEKILTVAQKGRG